MPEQVTKLLLRWNHGDDSALQELMPIVYEELRRLARSAVRRDRRESILQPPALVHEVWLKLAGKEHLSVEGRTRFYAFAAKVMRDILVDRLRKRHAAKRGGAQLAIPLEAAGWSERPRHVDFLILDEAMTRLGELKPRYMQIVELRYLGGLTIGEASEVLIVSHARVEREWGFARAWLRRELGRGVSQQVDGARPS